MDPNGQSQPQKTPLPHITKLTKIKTINDTSIGSDNKTSQDGFSSGAVSQVKILKIVTCPPAYQPSQIRTQAKNI